MPSSTSARQQELISLLSDKSLGWLSPSDEQRLNDLLKEFPQVKPVDFEFAAADATLNELKELETVEDELFQDLTMDATSLLTDDEIQSMVDEENRQRDQQAQPLASPTHTVRRQGGALPLDPAPSSDAEDKNPTRINARVRVITPSPAWLDAGPEPQTSSRQWLPLALIVLVIGLVAGGVYWFLAQQP